MSTATNDFTQRERELGAIIGAYNAVTEQLKQSHERLRDEVSRLREELGRKNRQLRRRERLAALGEMAAGVAHEIRNPLAGIQMFASLLRRDLADRPDSLRLVERIIKGVGSLESIVTDILEFSRPTEPQPGRVNLGVLFREVVDLAASRGGASGVPVGIEDGAGDLELITDGRLLQRAVLNLVLNAVDATAGNRGQAAAGKVAGETPAPRRAGAACASSEELANLLAERRTATSCLAPGLAGETPTPRRSVTLGAKPGPRECVLITVSDEGPGIAADLMDRIFNPFFTTKSNGTGLGLAIVHQLVETLGGTVQAANRQSGGAVFSVTLPRVLEAQSIKGIRDGETERRRDGEKERKRGGLPSIPLSLNPSITTGRQEVAARL